MKDAGADMFTFHIETCKSEQECNDLISAIKQEGMYVCMCVCVYVCMCVCVYVYAYDARVHVFTFHIKTCKREQECNDLISAIKQEGMYVCMCVCVYVYAYHAL
jgi:pentose-5-phosphate-3-epimerase